MILKFFSVGPLATNCYLCCDEESGETVIIDPGFASEALVKEAKEHNVTYILLTHGHIDHIMGAAKIREITGAKIVAHKGEVERLSSAGANLYSALADAYGGGYTPFEADVIVKDGDCLNIGTHKIKVLHTPGHSEGSICYIISGVIFSGDTIFYQSHGRVDFPGGSYPDMIDSFYKLANLEGEYKIFPGHDESTTLDHEREHNPLTKFIR